MTSRNCSDSIITSATLGRKLPPAGIYIFIFINKKEDKVFQLEKELVTVF